MSQTFSNFTAAPYQGPPPQPLNVALCAPNKGKVVPIVINWANYPTNAVEINIQAGGNVIPAIDAIRSIVIDNTFHSAQISVQFPDTGFVVAAEPDSVISGFVLTYQLKFRIFRTVSSLPTAQTTLYLCDFLLDTYTQSNLPASVALWIGTSALNGETTYAPPALGTQFESSTISLANSGAIFGTIILGTPFTQGTIVVTSIEVSVYGSASFSAQPLAMTLGIVQNLLFSVFPFQYYAMNNLDGYGKRTLYSQSGLNLWLPATNIYSWANMGNVTPGGFAQLDLHYDYVFAGL